MKKIGIWSRKKTPTRKRQLMYIMQIRLKYRIYTFIYYNIYIYIFAVRGTCLLSCYKNDTPMT